MRFGSSRAMAAWAVAGSLIVAAAVAAGAQGGDTFEDIADAGVHAGAVEVLIEAGIVEGTGCGSGRFVLTSPSIAG